MPPDFPQTSDNIGPNSVDAPQVLGVRQEKTFFSGETTPALRDVVALACASLAAPVALLTLDDGVAQRTICAAGPLADRVPIGPTAASRARAPEENWIEDLRQSPERDDRLLAEPPHFVFRASAPLSGPSLPLGSLTILDVVPRAPDAAARARLAQFASIAGELLARERDAALLRKAREEQKAQQKLIESQLERFERQNRTFDQASQLAKLGTWEIDHRTGKILWSDNLYRLYGLPCGTEISREAIMARYTPASLKRLTKMSQNSTRTLSGYVFEGAIIDADGGKRWFRQIAEVDVEDGKVVRRYGSKQDITEQKKLIDRLSFIATRDSLTHLANRDALRTALDETLKWGKKDELNALFILDLDGFKFVNDSFGHPAGDYCLRVLGRRLRRLCPAKATVARLGGDEFAFLIRAVESEAFTEQLASCIISEFRLPVKHKGASYQLSTSIGFTSWRTSRNKQTEELLTEADLALNAAKGAGKNTFRAFTPEMKKLTQMRSRTLSEISRALAEGQLEIFYQPKFRLADRTPAGYEALLRWRRGPDRLVSPGAFQAALDDPEMSRRIGHFVVSETLSQAARWKRDGLPFGRIAINLSRSQFQNETFVLDLIAMMNALELAPSDIEVEITEGVLLNLRDRLMQRHLRDLKRAGICVTLDDFGTGFASLTHLRSLGADCLKIDRSFVSELADNGADRAIVGAVISLAAALNMQLVAEGIETEEQLAILAEMGCHYGQGYLFAKPQSAQVITQLMRAIAARTGAA